MLFAAIEVEIEGKHGWAEKTSTWFRMKGLPAKIYGFCMGGKPLTGYHMFMFFLPFVMFHSHFFMGVAWSFPKELLVWAVYFAWAPTWDYLWFVLNPYYGVKKFKKENVWWHSHSHWLFNVTPMDYLVGWGTSVVFALAAAGIAQENILFTHHLQFLGWFVVFTFVTIIFVAPLYKSWHVAMRRQDDRENSSIFHIDD